jgi:hypothetical protein
MLRVPEPNPLMPAFVGGMLAWGTPPRAGPAQEKAPEQQKVWQLLKQVLHNP